MRELILDTNFLLIPFQFKVDVFSELEYLVDEPYQLVTSNQVTKELKKIAGKGGKTGAAGKFAIKLLEVNKGKIKFVETELSVDDWILEYSKENKAIAATNDIKLKRRLKKYGIKVIGLRTKTKLGYV
jgi:rRNA-processing protein FCF1